MPVDVLLLVLFPFDFLVYISVALVILFFFSDCFVLFFNQRGIHCNWLGCSGLPA